MYSITYSAGREQREGAEDAERDERAAGDDAREARVGRVVRLDEEVHVGHAHQSERVRRRVQKRSSWKIRTLRSRGH